MTMNGQTGRRELFPGGPLVDAVALGTSPLGGMPDVYGYDVDQDVAIRTVKAALAAGLNMIDTSNEYGRGESERRIGAALAEEAHSSEIVIATKADPSPGSNDFSYRRIFESFEESTSRLGVDYVDVFYLHDPERFDFSEVTGPGGALDAALELRSAGRVGAVGVAGGDIDEMRRYIDTGKLQILLNHNHYNLLDRSADPLIQHARDADVAFVNAAPYASGILARGPVAGARFQYRQPTTTIAEAVKRFERAADAHGVPLAAVALQFSTRDPRIASTVVGASSPERARSLVENMRLQIPRQVWIDVEDAASV